MHQQTASLCQLWDLRHSCLPKILSIGQVPYFTEQLCNSLASFSTFPP